MRRAPQASLSSSEEAGEGLLVGLFVPHKRGGNLESTEGPGVPGLIHGGYSVTIS